MKAICIAIVGLLFSNSIFAQSSALRYGWAKQQGGAMSDAANSITTDVSGNIYTAGYFQDVADFDPSGAAFNLTSRGAEDIFVSKTDADGNLIWAKQIGGIGSDKAYDIEVDGYGNVFVVGQFADSVDFDPNAGTSILWTMGHGTKNAFLLKINSLGNLVWAKNFGGTQNVAAYNILLDAHQNVLIVGQFSGTADFDPNANTTNLTSAGGNDIFINKLNIYGDLVWTKRIGGTGNETAYSVAVDKYEDLYLTGEFEDVVDFDPSANTNYLIAQGNTDIFVAKIDDTGSLFWARQFGDVSNDRGKALAVDTLGNAYITGFFNGVVDFDPSNGHQNLTSEGHQDIFVLKLDIMGHLVWAKNMGGSSNDIANSLVLDSNSDLYLTGSFQGTADFDPNIGAVYLTSAGLADIFISKLSNDGNFLWAGSFSGTGADAGQSIILTATNDVLTAGIFQGTVDFDPSNGSNTMSSTNGSSNAFIHKLTQSFTGVQTVERKDFIQVYPNPTTHFLNIKTSDLLDNATIQITNSLGQMVAQYHHNTGNLIALDISNLPAGTYWVQIPQLSTHTPLTILKQ